jgi:hypothetical protein
VTKGELLSWDWDHLSILGQSKAFRSSYWFLLLVPTVAKVLGHVPSEIRLFGTIYYPHVDLPFSWVALFFCAVFVSAGNLIYSLFCPDLIKRFRDYQSFDNAARGSEFLRRSLNAPTPGEIDAVVDNIVAEKGKRRDPATVLNTKDQLKRYGKAGADSFYFVRDTLNMQRPTLRMIAAILYLCGFLLLGWLAVQNIWSVVCYLFYGNAKGASPH